MSFYSVLSEYYDEIFPADPDQAALVNAFSPRDADILDVGCGAGGLSGLLASAGHTVTGIDYDAAMVERAIIANQGLRFIHASMLDISSLFNSDTFDTVVSFGNVLPHLSSDAEIQSFFTAAHAVLKPGGRLLLQILNYDRILRDHITELPLIITPRVTFRRTYRFRDDGTLDFITAISGDHGISEQSIVLRPLLPRTVNDLLQQAGFGAVTLYGSFAQNPLAADSFILVISATK